MIINFVKLYGPRFDKLRQAILDKYQEIYPNLTVTVECEDYKFKTKVELKVYNNYSGKIVNRNIDIQEYCNEEAIKVFLPEQIKEYNQYYCGFEEDLHEVDFHLGSDKTPSYNNQFGTELFRKQFANVLECDYCGEKRYFEGHCSDVASAYKDQICNGVQITNIFYSKCCNQGKHRDKGNVLNILFMYEGYKLYLKLVKKYNEIQDIDEGEFLKTVEKKFNNKHINEDELYYLIQRLSYQKKITLAQHYWDILMSRRVMKVMVG